MRGVPATREPFEARADKRRAKDAGSAWRQLIDSEAAVELPSTYFIGAQATTAENVEFLDRGRFQFLLHFWPLAATLYVPQVLDPMEGKRSFLGFAVVLPDVARLRAFCEDLPVVLRQRTAKMDGYRPAEAIVVLAAESAFDLATRLKARVAVREGERATVDLVHGVEVIHMNKEGNNVRVLSAKRIDLEPTVVDEYERVRPLLKDLLFRQQWLTNLLAGRAWFKGFERSLATLPHKKQGFGANTFRHDARQMFEMARKTMTEKQGPDDESLEASIFRFVQNYVLRRTKEKYGLSWEAVEGTPKVQDYRDAKEKVARDAFLAVRSRTGAAFLDYFASTLGSAPQHLGRERFVAFTQALRANPDDARTLTLLALSAVA
jgi:CRISPR-associated protein Cmx8